MAIAKVKKLTLIGLLADRDRIVTSLQWAGILQFIDIAEQGSADVISASTVQAAPAQLMALQDAIAFLAGYQKKPSFLSAMAPVKPAILKQQADEMVRTFDYGRFLSEAGKLRARLTQLHHDHDKLIQERLLLTPWRSLRCSLEARCGISSCALVLGMVPHRFYAPLIQGLERDGCAAPKPKGWLGTGLCPEARTGPSDRAGCGAVSVDVVHEDKANQYLAILYRKDDFAVLEPLLKNSHFLFVTLGHGAWTVEERLSAISRQIIAIDGELREVKRHITRLADDRLKLMVVYDTLATQARREAAGAHFAHARYTFHLSAWIKESDIRLLQTEFLSDVACFIAEPAVEDVVPVALTNARLIEPFECITQIYGMPRYGELDPTPYLAPFFFLYFGFCVSDVGYGLMLMLASRWILKKFRMGPQGKKFFRLFFYCGVSTVIVGALTGSWFGNIIDVLGGLRSYFSPLVRWKDRLVLLDPMKEPTKLLAIALSFGIVQVWFGNIVAAIGNMKNKRYLDILLDQLPMLTLLFGLTGLGLVFLNLLKPNLSPLFSWPALAGAVGLACTQGRSEKGMGSKIFYGIYNLYNALSGYLSDVLSYSRLWALGLVTGAMAGTINLIALEFSRILLSFIPGLEKAGLLRLALSIIIFSVIFVCGHLVSFLMNLLGAFVHPVRLQFVEFFSKFFKAGGVPFRPFKTEARYVSIQ